jgi:hypothetical protein
MAHHIPQVVPPLVLIIFNVIWGLKQILIYEAVFNKVYGIFFFGGFKILILVTLSLDRPIYL